MKFKCRPPGNYGEQHRKTAVKAAGRSTSILLTAASGGVLEIAMRVTLEGCREDESCEIAGRKSAKPQPCGETKGRKRRDILNSRTDTQTQTQHAVTTSGSKGQRAKKKSKAQTPTISSTSTAIKNENRKKKRSIKKPLTQCNVQ